MCYAYLLCGCLYLVVDPLLIEILVSFYLCRNCTVIVRRDRFYYYTAVSASAAGPK